MKITRIPIFFLLQFIINVDDYLLTIWYFIFTRIIKYIVKSESKHLKLNLLQYNIIIYTKKILFVNHNFSTHFSGKREIKKKKTKENPELDSLKQRKDQLLPFFHNFDASRSMDEHRQASSPSGVIK